MATFYLDPVNGNDANDGTTFANRWKTWTSGATAARIAPGDTIRVIASPDPTSVGSATWTDNSNAITLASACTATVDNCDSAWTAAANVTATATATNRKQGTNCANLAVAAAFTTGKIAYKATGTLDLSSYQQISFWLRTTLATAGGTLELRLCSDTTGDTAVHTIPIDQTMVASSWRVVAKDFGAALSSSIQSVALYATVDPSTVTINLDNIIACKAASANDSLTHLSLIGKNTAGEPEWYPIISIDGTTVSFGNGDAILSSVNNMPRPYRGTSETVTTYKRQPLDIVNGQGTALSSTRNFQDSGSDGSPILISGGWNRTDMSTQSGESWISGSHWADAICTFAGRSWVSTEKIGAAHLAKTFVSNTNSNGLDLRMAGVVGCSTAFDASFATSIYADLGNVVQCGVSAFTNAINESGINDMTLVARRVTGSPGAAFNIGANAGRTVRLLVDTIDNNGSYGINPSNSGRLFVGPVTMQNNDSADVNVTGAGDMVMISPKLNSTTPVSVGSAAGDTVRCHNYGGTAGDHRVFSGAYRIVTDSSTRHTASGVSWKLSPTSVTGQVGSQRPASLPLTRRRVSSGVTTTFSCWLRRDNTGLSLGLRVRGGQVAGVASDQIVLMTAAINTWEQVSLSVTPTEDGVIELEGIGYGGTTYNGWFDDLSVS